MAKRKDRYSQPHGATKTEEVYKYLTPDTKEMVDDVTERILTNTANSNPNGEYDKKSGFSNFGEKSAQELAMRLMVFLHENGEGDALKHTLAPNSDGN